VIAIGESAERADRTHDERLPRSRSVTKSPRIVRYLILFSLVVLPLGAIGGEVTREAYLVQTNQAQHGIFVATSDDCQDGECTWHGDFIPSDGGPVAHGAILNSGNPTKVGDEIQVQAVHDLNLVDVYALGSAPEWMWPVGVLLMAGAVLAAWYFARVIRRQDNPASPEIRAIDR